MPPPYDDDEALEVCSNHDHEDEHDLLEASAALKDITKNVNSFISQQEKVRPTALCPMSVEGLP